MTVVENLRAQISAAISYMNGLSDRVRDLNSEVVALQAKLTELEAAVGEATTKLDEAVPDEGGSMGGIAR